MADLITNTAPKEVQTVTDTAATLASNRFSTEAGDLSKVAQGPSGPKSAEPSSLVMTNPYEKETKQGGTSGAGSGGGEGAGWSLPGTGGVGAAVGGAGGGPEGALATTDPGAKALPGGSSSWDQQNGAKGQVTMIPNDITLKAEQPAFDNAAPLVAPAPDVPAPVSAPTPDVPAPVVLPGTVHN